MWIRDTDGVHRGKIVERTKADPSFFSIKFADGACYDYKERTIFHTRKEAENSVCEYPAEGEAGGADDSMKPSRTKSQTSTPTSTSPTSIFVT